MTSRHIRRTVVIGCGIAGPATAMFLRRLGHEVVICERRRASDEDEGLFLGVAPNGMRVLAELGVHRAVEGISEPCRGFEFQNHRGRAVGAIDRRADAARFGAELRMVRRSDLHRVLTEAARRSGATVAFGRRLVTLDRGDATVVAGFDDGTHEQGDILIGCDGIRSAVRQMVVPEAPVPAYSGLVDFGGFARCAAPIPVGVNVMVFGRRAFFGAFKTTSGEVWWFHNSGERRPDAIERGPVAVRAHILALHRDDPSWIHQVVDATGAIAGPYPLNDILSMPRWHDGRVCVIGDAAHATTPSAGQGASLALEDAMVLAQCLRDLDGHEAAFSAFERARRARVETIVKQSRRNGNSKAVSGAVALWLRDRLLPVFLKIGTKAQERQYAYRLSWTERYS